MYENVFTGDRAIDEPFFKKEIEEYFQLYAELPFGLLREFDELFGLGSAKTVASQAVRIHEMMLAQLGDEHE
jgi:hypothetical protein